LLKNDGQIVPLTEDHKLSLASERKWIKEMGVELESGQSRINGIGLSRAFGDWFPKEMVCGIVSEPFLSELYELGAGDMRVVIATDGLWDIISGSRAFELINSTSNAHVAAEKLLQTALQSSKCNDNVTVIVVNLNKIT